MSNDPETDFIDPAEHIEESDVGLSGTEHDNRLQTIAEVLADGIGDLEYVEIDNDATDADSEEPVAVFLHELKKKRDAAKEELPDSTTRRDPKSA